MWFFPETSFYNSWGSRYYSRNDRLCVNDLLLFRSASFQRRNRKLLSASQLSRSKWKLTDHSKQCIFHNEWYSLRRQSFPSRGAGITFWKIDPDSFPEKWISNSPSFSHPKLLSHFKKSCYVRGRDQTSRDDNIWSIFPSLVILWFVPFLVAPRKGWKIYLTSKISWGQIIPDTLRDIARERMPRPKLSHIWGMKVGWHKNEW